MNILGIDPGLSGACALVSPKGVQHVIDMPTIEVAVNKKTRRVLDIYNLARWLDVQAVDLAVLEDVGVRPGEGAVGAFKFGRCMGVAEGIVAANLISVRYVPPSVWKRALGLEGQDKDASRRMASQIFPASSHLWPLKKHDGRAEATLLAYYGSRMK